MGTFLFYVVAILTVVVLLWIATEFYKVAEMKGFSELKYFWISFLFPLCGYLLVIALPDRNQREVQVTMTAADTSVKQTTSFDSDELPDL